MSGSILFIALILFLIVAFKIGKRRILTLADGGKIHSLPSYYGTYALFYAATPAFLLWAIWSLFEPHLVQHFVLEPILLNSPAINANELGLIYNDIKNLAQGLGDISTAKPIVVEAVNSYNILKNNSQIAAFIVIMAIAALGLQLARSKISPNLRARQAVERIIMIMLMVCSCIAILTTIGIVLSLIFETSRFFAKVPIQDFLFGIE